LQNAATDLTSGGQCPPYKTNKQDTEFVADGIVEWFETLGRE